MTATADQVRAALATVVEPDLGKDLVAARLVRGVEVSDGTAKVRVALTTPAHPHQAQLRQAVDQAVRGVAGIRDVELTLAADAPEVQPKLGPVRHVIGIGAGKGGVGKSTVAVNLALALSQAGAKVGLLDADIYGPSVPIMLGLRDAKPAVNAARKIVPAERYGLKCISIGFMIDEDTAVAWRGPMVARAVTQFIEDVAWGELDYLIVDLPPGTGDIILSLCQAIPLSGAVVVTTPQDVAFADVLRAVKMFGMLNVEMIGLVENMSYFHCPDNGKDYPIFGPSHTADHAEKHGLQLLGKLPLDMAVSPNADAGRPIVVAEPNSQQAAMYREMAGQVATKQAQLAFAKAEKANAGKGFFTTRPAGAPAPHKP